MLMICRRRVPLVALLLLLQLISGSAWASDETPERSDEAESAPCTHHKKSITEAVEVWKGVIVTNIDVTTVSESNIAGTPREEADDETQAAAPAVSSPPHAIIIDDLQLRRRKSPTQLEAAQITTAPRLPLLARQDQSQVDQLNAQLQSLRQSAQQALQALSDQSRSVSQASQQLGQESSRLSQASSQLSASSLQLSLQLSIATNSVQSLTAALSAAISSGNSAFASCTSSASSMLATSLGQALAQATQARVEADTAIKNAQSSAVSVTMAAAIIVGSCIASSLITVGVIILCMRRRRKKQRNAQALADAADGAASRPGTSASYNSMATAAAAGPQDAKTEEETAVPPAQMTMMTGAMAQGVPSLSRFQSARIVDVSRNASNSSKNSKTSNSAAAAAAAPIKLDKPPFRDKRVSYFGERLSRLGLMRRPMAGAGEALTTDYVQRSESGARKPVGVAIIARPADAFPAPPAPEEAGGGEDDEEGRRRAAADNAGGGGAHAKTPTFSVFPKVDPDPKGTAEGRQQQNPTLQAWLQTASARDMDGSLPPDVEAAAVAVNPEPVAVEEKKKSRLSEVMWPLQGTTRKSGLGRSATDASSRYSKQGFGFGGAEDEHDEEVPVVMVRENPATRSVVVGGVGNGGAVPPQQKKKKVGLPGRVRKVGHGSLPNVPLPIGE